MDIEWARLRTEYITTDTSYRKLSEKYGVPLRTIAHTAKRDEWVKQKQQHCDSVATKILDAAAKKAVDRSTRMKSVADKFLDKIEKAIDVMDVEYIISDKSGTRALVAALQGIRDLQDIKSELDIAEQEARIAKLRRDSGEDSESSDEHGVFILPAVQVLKPPEEDGEHDE